MTSHQIIDAVPAGDGAVGDIPEYVYPDKFYGVELSQCVFTWLRHSLPRERTDGQPFLGAGICIWRPEDRNWRKPWMVFALDADMNHVNPTEFTGDNAEQMLYVHNAMRKAKFTLRVGLPSQAALESHRHLREAGDFPYNGCVIIGHALGQGVIVSISGYTKEQDASAAISLGEYLTDEMRSVIDELESDGHYWVDGHSKKQLLEMISAGIRLNEFASTISREP